MHTPTPAKTPSHILCSCKKRPPGRGGGDQGTICTLMVPNSESFLFKPAPPTFLRLGFRPHPTKTLHPAPISRPSARTSARPSPNRVSSRPHSRRILITQLSHMLPPIS